MDSPFIDLRPLVAIIFFTFLACRFVIGLIVGFVVAQVISHISKPKTKKFIITVSVIFGIVYGFNFYLWWNSPAMLKNGNTASFWLLPLDLSKEQKAEKKRKEEIQAARDAAFDAAKAVLKEQCNTINEKIYRSVKNVDGVLLLKNWRDKNTDNDAASNKDAQWEYATWDGVDAESYISSFLKNKENNMGYSFVDVLLDNKQIARYASNYNGYWKNYLPDASELNPSEPAQYAITFENNTDPELRKHWIAGTTFKIIDMQTNELLAEKTIFVMGNSVGHWKNVQTCDDVGRERTDRKKPVYYFINSVLKPREHKSWD